MKLETLEPAAPPMGSPFDLRVSVSEKIDETDIRSAMESGDWGFIHSFTTGSAVDGPGVRIVGWLSGCQFRCVFCHNPDTWKVTNGTPVRLERAVEVVARQVAGLDLGGEGAEGAGELGELGEEHLRMEVRGLKEVLQRRQMRSPA